jgi:dihydrofolate synthase / folylpolyglutamate synthase
VDSGLKNYQGALDRLYARTGSTAKFGLDRTRKLLALLGNPHDRFPSFHVAGTNGKGSVVVTLDTLLSAKGFAVGRYTSPHLVDFRERIAVNGELISEAEVEEFLNDWENQFEKLEATFFEITTALAFHHFASRHVDVAVIETGLGGRLDSTNVISPLAAGVTSIGVDHTEFLGSSLAEIAREKAGIFKPGVPAIYGRSPDEARMALIDTAQSIGASPIIAAQDMYRPSNVHVVTQGTAFDVAYHDEHATLRTALIGGQQADNAVVALAMLDAAGAAYRVTLPEAGKGLARVNLPGRFERRGKFILDVAHNTDGMRAVVETLLAVEPPRPVFAVLGILRDKDWPTMMSILCPAVDRTILTSPPSAPAERAWDPALAREYGEREGFSVKLVRDLEQAVAESSQAAATVLITGSFHTVGDASLFIDRV